MSPGGVVERRIMQRFAAQKLRPGDLLPSAREMSRRLSLPLDQVVDAYSRLVERCRISLVHDQHFLGAWDVLTAPGFARPSALRHAVGEYYALREEYPQRSPLVNCVTISSADLQGGPVHSHDFCELVLVRDGAAMHVHDNTRYPIYTGDCFAVLPGQSHSFSHSNRLTVSNVMFMVDELQCYAPQLAELPGYQGLFVSPQPGQSCKVHLSLSRQREAHALVERIAAALKSGLAASCLESFTSVVQLLILVCRAAEVGSRPAVATQVATRRDDIVQRVTAFLEENYARELSLSQIAATVYLSVSRLQHIFKEATGLSLYEYLIGLRIGEACRLLATTTTPMSRVAADLGFRKQSYFSELFHSRIGTTPSAYRRLHSRKLEIADLPAE